MGKKEKKRKPTKINKNPEIGQELEISNISNPAGLDNTGEDIGEVIALTEGEISRGLPPVTEPEGFYTEVKVKEINKEDTVVTAENKKVFNEILPNITVEDFGEENTILIRRTLRSGQSVHYEGNVIIIGDVNPGAEVVATGNIVVMGSFRGVAHAGAMGNEDAIVAAFKLQPTQLRIANHITRAPDENYSSPDFPEIARIKNGVVIIETCQPCSEKQAKIV